MESVTVTLALKAPETVGVPLITPVDEAIVRPAGNPVAVQLYGVVPPVAATVALYDVPTAPPGRGDAVVMESAGLIVMLRFLLTLRCVGVVESVTVTLAVNVPEAVGVPLTMPVDEAMVKPAGNPVAVQL